jgi:flagellar hook assembly protein FlgD
VLIEIFDIRGARVASLVTARLPVGYHTVVWDGRDDRGRRAAAGVYFYRMKTADRVLTRKMARLR